MLRVDVFEVKSLFLFVLVSLLFVFSPAYSDLAITPAEDYLCSGPEGGPFAPAQKNYMLTNQGGATITWGVIESVDWFDCSPEWGDLDPNESVEVIVSINSAADSLAASDYVEDVVFTDITNGVDETRQVILSVGTVSTGPVAWWKLDGDPTDSSGNEHDGATYGDPNWIAEGMDGSAIQLDGDGDYIIIGNYNGISGANARTVCAWVKPADATFQTVAQWGQDSTGKLFLLSIDASKNIAVAVYGGGVYSTQPVTDGQWHHVAAVLEQGELNSENIKLYVDGDSSSTVSYEGTCTINTDINEVPVHIGAWYQYSTSNPTRFLNGLIDDVRIYDRALT